MSQSVDRTEMSARERVMSSSIYKLGKPFYLCHIARDVKLDADLVQEILEELVAEGRVAHVMKDGRPLAKRYYVISTAQILVTKRWDSNLFAANDGAS